MTHSTFVPSFEDAASPTCRFATVLDAGAVHRLTLELATEDGDAADVAVTLVGGANCWDAPTSWCCSSNATASRSATCPRPAG